MEFAKSEEVLANSKYLRENISCLLLLLSRDYHIIFCVKYDIQKYKTHR